MDYPDQGYPEGRFASDVDDDLLCAICLNVLREPLQCVKNEHHFCAPCIKRHLNSTPKCPSCMEDLSVRTLRKPARYLTKHLSSLQIKCDYEGRGCRELIKLEQLRHHVEGCGYAPVRVPCDGCKQMMNTRDMMQHECPAKAAKCHDCTSIKKQVDELKETVNGVLQTVDSLKNEIGEFKVAFHNLGELARKEVREMKDCLEKFKENQATGISQPVVVEEPLEDTIVVIGGCGGGKRLTSAEMYVWSKQKWVPFPSTNHPRSDSSAVVYQNKILVMGGKNHDGTLTDSIEAIQIIDGRPGQWYKNPHSLPAAAIGHCCLIYEECLYLVGGCEHDDCTVSDKISCIPLCAESPAAQWILKSSMLNPRCSHGVELFGDGMVIIGGARESQGYNVSSFEPSVLSLNLKTNTLCEISELHSCISDMATVPWGDHIVLLGGKNASGDPLNTAKMYNIKTGKIYQLPPMKYKRLCSTAVALNNSIVVMGGHDGTKCLNTVECFSFATYTWSELPQMSHSRSSATSVVVPIKASEVP